jgi:hypothetical protein
MGAFRKGLIIEPKILKFVVNVLMDEDYLKNEYISPDIIKECIQDALVESNTNWFIEVKREEEA